MYLYLLRKFRICNCIYYYFFKVIVVVSIIRKKCVIVIVPIHFLSIVPSSGYMLLSYVALIFSDNFKPILLK